MEQKFGGLVDQMVFLGRELRGIRNRFELTLNQAASALGVSPVTLDGWEQGRKPQVSAVEAAAAYDRFVADTARARANGNNVLFGVFPVRVARDILGLSQVELAELLGYSHSSWSKMEANSRIVPKPVIDRLEEMVQQRWACVQAAHRPHLTVVQ